jgi:hypothetical protein
MFPYAVNHGRAAGHAAALSLSLLTGLAYFMKENLQRHAARSFLLFPLAMLSIVIYVFKK